MTYVVCCFLLNELLVSLVLQCACFVLYVLFSLFFLSSISATLLSLLIVFFHHLSTQSPSAPPTHVFFFLLFSGNDRPLQEGSTLTIISIDYTQRLAGGVGVKEQGTTRDRHIFLLLRDSNWHGAGG